MFRLKFSRSQKLVRDFKIKLQRLERREYEAIDVNLFNLLNVVYHFYQYFCYFDVKQVKIIKKGGGKLFLKWVSTNLISSDLLLLINQSFEF